MCPSQGQISLQVARPRYLDVQSTVPSLSFCITSSYPDVSVLPAADGWREPGCRQAASWPWRAFIRHACALRLHSPKPVGKRKSKRGYLCGPETLESILTPFASVLVELWLTIIALQGFSHAFETANLMPYQSAR